MAFDGGTTWADMGVASVQNIAIKKLPIDRQSSKACVHNAGIFPAVGHHLPASLPTLGKE